MGRKIHYNTSKATMVRERVRKHEKHYESAVRAEIQRREISDRSSRADQLIDNDDDPGPNPNSEQIPYSFDDNMLEFKDKIKLWSVKHCITKGALNDLLSILIIFGFNFLPKDSRTLLKTPTTVDIRNLSDGALWYHGIQKSLQFIFHKIRYSVVDTIHLDFNFDGVALFNSSNKSFWPIRGM